MGTCILDLTIDTMRLKTLQKMLKAYRPVGVSLSFVLEELGFEDHAIGADFMKKLACIIPEKTGEGAERVWNTKETNIDTSAIFNEEKLLL
jgi:hypothetical protein